MLWSQQSELWNGGFVCSFRFAKSFSLFTGVLALGALHGYFVWLLSSIRSYLELIVSLFVKRTIINFAYQSYYRILLFFVTQRRQSTSRHMEQQTTAEWFFFCNIYFSLLDEKWLHFLSICHLWLILVQFILYHASPPSIGRNVSLAHSTRTQPANEKKKIFTINLPNVALQKAISIKLVFLMPQRAYRKTVRQLEPTHTQARARHNVDKLLLLLQRFCCCYFMFFSQFFSSSTCSCHCH